MPFAADADPRFGVFTLRTDCPRCGAHLPVNGPVPVVDCGDCAARVEVPARLIADLADTFEERWPAVETSDTATLGDLTWRWTIAPAPGPTCGACEAPLGPEEVPFVPCAVCGATTPAFPAPDVLRTVAKSAGRVFGGDAEGTRPVVAIAPVAMGCPQCGAGLSITTAHQRLTPCGHCGVSVHLPDAVWRQLHPPRTVRAWTVRFEGESRPARRKRVERERAEQDRRKKEAVAETQRRAREADAARREREAAATRELKERRARERAAAERRFRLTTMPVVALAWLVTPFALGGMLAATAWYVLGTPTILLGRVSPDILAAAPRVVVLAATIAALCGWALAFGASALRTRQSFWELLPLGLLHLCTSSVPMVGWFFASWWAIAYLRGQEPTLDSGPKKVPWSVRVPPAAYLLAFGVFTHVAIAAGMDITMGTLVERMFDD